VKRNIFIISAFFSITALSFENPFEKMVDAAKEKLESSKNAIKIEKSEETNNSDSVKRNGVLYERDRDEATILLLAHTFPHTTAVEIIKDIDSNLSVANENISTVEYQMPIMKKGLSGDSYYTSHTLTAINLNHAIDCLKRLRENEMYLSSSPLLNAHTRKSELVQKTEKTRARCMSNYRKVKPLYLTALERYFVAKKAETPETFVGYVRSYFDYSAISQLDIRADSKVVGIFKELGCHIPENDLDQITC